MDEKKSNPELATLTIDELLDELKTRVDAMAVGLYRADGAPDEMQWMQRYHGHRIIVRGLVADLADHVRQPPDYLLERKADEDESEDES